MSAFGVCPGCSYVGALDVAAWILGGGAVLECPRCGTEQIDPEHESSADRREATTSLTPAGTGSVGPSSMSTQTPGPPARGS